MVESDESGDEDGGGGKNSLKEVGRFFLASSVLVGRVWWMVTPGVGHWL